MDETTVGDVAALLVIVVPLLVAMAATVADRSRSFSHGTTARPVRSEPPDSREGDATTKGPDGSRPGEP